jgi:RHS repeat-associated protein
LIRKTPTETRFYHQDALGSVVALTDETGFGYAAGAYDAWGDNYAAPAPARYGYTGREPDSAQRLVFYRERWYWPAFRRFISKDPLGLAGGINPYVYAGNSPTNFNDPMGRMPRIPSFLPTSYWGIAADAGKVLSGGVVCDMCNYRSSSPDQARLKLGSFADIGVGFTPAGSFADLYGAATGQSLFGEEDLAVWERVLGLVPGASEVLGIARGVRGIDRAADLNDVFRVAPHGSMPSPRPGMESHHGLNSVWMEANRPGYNAADAPAVLLPKANHHATFDVFNTWRVEEAARQGVSPRNLDWMRVSPGSIWGLSERQFDAARVPEAVRREYFQQLNDYMNSLER